MTFNATTRSLDNKQDTGRTFPVKALAPKMLNEAKMPVVEKIAGPAAGATVGLSKPAIPGSSAFLVESYVTATRAWTTGANGAGAGPPIRAQGVEFSFNPADPTKGGNASLTDIDTFDHSTETWIVQYFANEPDGTVSGPSVKRAS
jgi:hypothetical protein